MTAADDGPLRPRRTPPLRPVRVDPAAPREPLSEIAAREEDLRRSARMLANHSIRTVLDMAGESGAGAEAVASMFEAMAAAHRRAAALVARAGLETRLLIGRAKP